MANTIENISGLESGSTVEFEALTGTNSVQSSIKRTGTYAFRVNPTTTATGSGRVSGHQASGVFGSIGAATGFCGFWFRVDTLPAANDEEILRWVSSTTTLKCAVRITSTGTLKLYNISGTNTATSSTALSTATWYRIYVRATNSTSGLFEVKIYNSTGTLLETLSDSACDMGATNVSRVILGKHVNSNSQTVDFYYDDIWVDSQDYPPTELWQVDYMGIASDGTNQWTGGTGASNYTQINERPLSITEYIQDPAAAAPVTYTGNMQTFAAAGITNTTITAVKVFAYAADVVSSTNTFQMGLRSNATDSLTSTNNTTAAAIEYGKILTTDPNTSAAWTQSGLEASLIKFVENTSSDDIRVYWGGFFVLTMPASGFTPKVIMY